MRETECRTENEMNNANNPTKKSSDFLQAYVEKSK